MHGPWWAAGLEDGSVGAGLDARGEGDVDGRLRGDHVHAHQLGDAPATGNRGSHDVWHRTMCLGTMRPQAQRYRSELLAL